MGFCGRCYRGGGCGWVFLLDYTLGGPSLGRCYRMGAQLIYVYGSLLFRLERNDLRNPRNDTFNIHRKPHPTCAITMRKLGISRFVPPISSVGLPALIQIFPIILNWRVYYRCYLSAHHLETPYDEFHMY